jgi:hypothetical protein
MGLNPSCAPPGRSCGHSGDFRWAWPRASVDAAGPIVPRSAIPGCPGPRGRFTVMESPFGRLSKWNPLSEGTLAPIAGFRADRAGFRIVAAMMCVALDSGDPSSPILPLRCWTDWASGNPLSEGCPGGIPFRRGPLLRLVDSALWGLLAWWDRVPSRGVATALLSRVSCSIRLPGAAGRRCDQR